jgi:hypothetical protein
MPQHNPMLGFISRDKFPCQCIGHRISRRMPRPKKHDTNQADC